MTPIQELYTLPASTVSPKGVEIAITLNNKEKDPLIYLSCNTRQTWKTCVFKHVFVLGQIILEKRPLITSHLQQSLVNKKAIKEEG